MNKEKQQVFIVAPVLHYGEHVARIFNIPRTHVVSSPHHFRGRSHCVILFLTGMRWNPDKRQEMEQTLIPGDHTIIYVPEIQEIHR